MNGEHARPIVARLRRRMLLALGRGTSPLPHAAAYALLPALVERFAANDDLTDPQGEAFFAALNADPDLAESFAILAEATVTTGALAPSPRLAARLAAIPQRPIAPTRAPRLPVTFGQPIAVAHAIETRHQRATATPGPSPTAAASAPPVRLLREAAAPYDPRDPLEPAPFADHDPPIFRLSDPAGVLPPADLVLLTRRVAATVTLTLHLREPDTTAPAAHAWRVAARLGQRTLAGAFTAPATWELSRPLTVDEFATLTIAIHPQ